MESKTDKSLEPDKKCRCTGIRFCNYCKDPSFRAAHKDLYPLDASQDIQTFRLSPCGRFCIHVNGLLDLIVPTSDLGFSGVHVFPDFIDTDQESALASDLLTHPNWVESQSGRRKIDFGPQANFKKRKLKVGHFAGLPKCMEPIINKIMQGIASGAVKNSNEEDVREIMMGFEPVEVNVLEYEEARGSNIAPHMDDFWLWGERIFGLNLLSDTVMTFQKDNVEIEVPVLRRALYLIAGKSRFEWMHGIKAQHISGKRMVCTIRELSEEFNQADSEIGAKLKAIAKNYI